MDNSVLNTSHIGKKTNKSAGNTLKNRVSSIRPASSIPLKDRLNKGNDGHISSLEDLSEQASRLFSPYKPLDSTIKSLKPKLVSKKKITAKSFNKNINFNYLSTNPSSKQNKAPQTEKISKSDRLTLSKDQEDNIKKQSEQFFNQLTKNDSNTDYSQVVVFKNKDIEKNIKIEESANNIIIPLISHNKAGSSGLVVIKPKSQCGPLINLRGTMIVVFLDVEDNKVSFESSNLNKKRIVCSNQNQLLILPNDTFVLYNDSSDKYAKICILTSKKTGKELKYLRKVEQLKAVGNLF